MAENITENESAESLREEMQNTFQSLARIMADATSKGHAELVEQQVSHDRELVILQTELQRARDQIDDLHARWMRQDPAGGGDLSDVEVNYSTSTKILRYTTDGGDNWTTIATAVEYVP